MTSTKIKLFDIISIDNMTMVQTVSKINNSIKSNQHIHHTAVNASIIVDMISDEVLKESINDSDIINADGQAVVWASKILGNPLKERVAGIDLMKNMIESAHQNKFKIFFFGAREEIVTKVVSTYSEKYSPDIVAGYRNGYFDKSEEKSIAQDIANSGANILFVAISSPTKEVFLYQNKDILKDVNYIMSVGGSFDVVAGKVKRAPIWMQKNGLEWFYRFLQEPKRMWKRYLVSNSKFIYLVFKTKFKKKKT